MKTTVYLNDYSFFTDEAEVFVINSRFSVEFETYEDDYGYQVIKTLDEDKMEIEFIDGTFEFYTEDGKIYETSSPTIDLVERVRNAVATKVLNIID